MSRLIYGGNGLYIHDCGNIVLSNRGRWQKADDDNVLLQLKWYTIVAENKGE